MSKRNMEKSRRDFLIKGMVVVPGLALSGVALSTLASPLPAEGKTGKAEPLSAPDLPVRDYLPSFFNQEEFNFIKAAVARLIPQDHLGPGALEAGVPEFIDRQLQTPYGVGANWYMQGPFQPDAPSALGYQMPLKPVEIYRLGIAEANTFARKKYGDVFYKLSPAQQDELLALMEAGKADSEKGDSAKLCAAFFATLLQNTREGFFSDPIHGGNKGLAGWKLIGFPGARADFMDWVESSEKYPFPPVSISGERG